MFVRDSEIFDAPDVFKDPIDLANISSFIFALDQETTGYSVSYWYVSNNGVEDTQYFKNYTSTDLTSNASLKLVGGFAFYQESVDAKAVIASYTQSGSLLEMTVDGTTYYFLLDEVNEKFTALRHAPYKAYLRNADGTYSTTRYLEFDGLGGAVYAENGILVDGKISILEKDILWKRFFPFGIYFFKDCSHWCKGVLWGFSCKRCSSHNLKSAW